MPTPTPRKSDDHDNPHVAVPLDRLITELRTILDSHTEKMHRIACDVEKIGERQESVRTQLNANESEIRNIELQGSDHARQALAHIDRINARIESLEKHSATDAALQESRQAIRSASRQTVYQWIGIFLAFAMILVTIATRYVR